MVRSQALRVPTHEGVRRGLPVHGSLRRTVEKVLTPNLLPAQRYRGPGAPGAGAEGVTTGPGVAVFASESLSSMRSWSSRLVADCDAGRSAGGASAVGVVPVAPAFVSDAEARSAAARRMESRRALCSAARRWIARSA